MLEIIVLKSCPAAGKSTWAKQKVSQDPDNWCIINNDQIRNMCNSSIYSPEYEKLISKFRLNMISTALKFNKNVIVDNVNADEKHFKEICRLAREVNLDIKVYEKHFYIDLQEAILRDSKRIGKECVGEKVITNFWNKLGKENFKNYKPKEEIFYKNKTINKLEQNKLLPHCIILDLDGTVSLLNGRDPYNAFTCDRDSANEFVVKLAKLYYSDNHELIFCSGREDKYREQTIRFLQDHFYEYDYQLFMRSSEDFRSDDIIKEEIYNKYIKDRYYVEVVVDDRLRVCRLWHKLGLNLLRVGDPDANF